LLCLLIVIARWIFIRRKPSKDESSEQGKAPAQFKTSNTGETTITNGFSADDISEIDADIDLTTPLPMSTGSSITRNDVSQYLVFSVYVFVFALDMGIEKRGISCCCLPSLFPVIVCLIYVDLFYNLHTEKTHKEDEIFNM